MSKSGSYVRSWEVVRIVDCRIGLWIIRFYLFHILIKKPIVLKFNVLVKFNVLDVDTRKDIDNEMRYDNDSD